jgi:hypothetical protein
MICFGVEWKERIADGIAVLIYTTQLTVAIPNSREINSLTSALDRIFVFSSWLRNRIAMFRALPNLYIFGEAKAQLVE